MAEKGIIFSAPMVRALLDGRKTQTRRLLKPQPVQHVPDLAFTWGKFSGLWPDDWFGYGNAIDGALPYAPGDRLYVRESFARVWWTEIFSGMRDLQTSFRAGRRVLVPEGGVANQANWPAEWRDDPMPDGQKWKPSIHMPRSLSRLTLLVTDVRVQRAGEIKWNDAVAEGMTSSLTPLSDFAALWDSLHNKPGERWADNPWIVAVTFEVRQGNIDRLGAP